MMMEAMIHEDIKEMVKEQMAKKNKKKHGMGGMIMMMATMETEKQGEQKEPMPVEIKPY